MRNEMKISTPSVRPISGWSYLALASLSCFTTASFALNDLEVVLDGYAYVINSDVAINLSQQIIYIAESDLENCLRPNDLIPLNNVDLTLITNNQGIGINQTRYAVESRLLFLTSESINLVCDNGVFIDQIFVQGFEPPELIFKNGYEN